MQKNDEKHMCLNWGWLQNSVPMLDGRLAYFWYPMIPFWKSIIRAIPTKLTIIDHRSPEMHHCNMEQVDAEQRAGKASKMEDFSCGFQSPKNRR